MFEHRLTIFLAFATFILLWIGATVNPTGSSLACPEAVLICHGSLFPEMTGGVFYEHGHRLWASSVGILQIVVTILLWRRRPRLRGWAIAALVMVCFQGSLGALTVKYKLPWIVSTLHLFSGLMYFALLICLALATKPKSLLSSSKSSLTSLRRVVLVAVVALLAQILLGGLVRHHGAALASVSLPFHYGSLWPSDAAFTIKLQMAHRIGGVVAGSILSVIAVIIFRRARGHSTIRFLCMSSIFLVLCQIGLGAWVIASFRSTPVAVAHFAVASALWASWVAMAFVIRASSQEGELLVRASLTGKAR